MPQLLSGGAAHFLLGFWWTKCPPLPYFLVGEGSRVATLILNAHLVTGEFHATHIPFTAGNTHFTDEMRGKFLV